MCSLDSERLIIRRFTCDDWLDLYEYLSKEEVVKFEPYNVYSQDECKIEAVNRSKNDAFFAVCLRENNKMIGNLYFQQLMPLEFLTWEIGYVFNPEFQGKGFATEACKEIIRYGFKHLGAHRIIGKCNPENISSWKLLERLSMRREGYFKQAAFFRRTSEGKPMWHDAYEYAILSEEWL